MNKVEAICRRTGYTFDLLKEKTKRREITLRRQIVMNHFKSKGWEYREVAGLFGQDRTTGNHADKVVKNLIDTKYPAWAYEVYLTVNSNPPKRDEPFGISKETIECVASM